MTLRVWVRSVAMLAALALAGRAMAIPAGQPDARGVFADVVMVDGTTGNSELHCSGVLVEPRTALTAAHCIDDGTAAMRWSVTKQGRDGRSYTASVRAYALGQFKNLTPGRLNRVDVQGDLAVLRLDKDLPLDPIQIFPQNQAIEPALKAKFQHAPGPEGLRGFVVGYGSTRDCTSKADCPATPTRTFKEVLVFRNAACNRPGSMEATDLHYASTAWCIGSQGINPTTHGDSGGGFFLLTKDGGLVLAGITSGGSYSNLQGNYLCGLETSVHYALGNMEPALDPALTTPTFDVSIAQAPTGIAPSLGAAPGAATASPLATGASLAPAAKPSGVPAHAKCLRFNGQTFCQ